MDESEHNPKEYEFADTWRIVKPGAMYQIQEIASKTVLPRKFRTVDTAITGVEELLRGDVQMIPRGARGAADMTTLTRSRYPELGSLGGYRSFARGGPAGQRKVPSLVETIGVGRKGEEEEFTKRLRRGHRTGGLVISEEETAPERVLLDLPRERGAIPIRMMTPESILKISPGASEEDFEASVEFHLIRVQRAIDEITDKVNESPVQVTDTDMENLRLLNEQRDIILNAAHQIRGRRKYELYVPDVIGKGLSRAKKVIEKAGLKVGLVDDTAKDNPVVMDRVKRGANLVVTKQVPIGGVVVREGQTVDLVVGLGPDDFIHPSGTGPSPYPAPPEETIDEAFKRRGEQVEGKVAEITRRVGEAKPWRREVEDILREEEDLEIEGTPTALPVPIFSEVQFGRSKRPYAPKHGSEQYTVVSEETGPTLRRVARPRIVKKEIVVTEGQEPGAPFGVPSIAGPIVHAPTDVYQERYAPPHVLPEDLEGLRPIDPEEREYLDYWGPHSPQVPLEVSQEIEEFGPISASDYARYIEMAEGPPREGEPTWMRTYRKLKERD